MLTNKDIRVENGNIVINGDKYPLDGQSPEAIMAIVEDNSDTTPTENSDAPITSGGVFTALAGKEDTLTFDTTPTAESPNPVTSDGIKTYVDTATTELGLFDIQNITVQSPGTGTGVEKVTRVLTDIFANITLTKNFTIVNVNYDNAYRASLFISAVGNAFAYSLGLYFGYYTDNVYKFVNNNGVITVKQLSEVS